jgi:hypothetical protein
MKKWAQEQIGNRCRLKAAVGGPEFGALIHIIPSFADGMIEGGYGDQIQWDVRMSRQGATEPIRVDKKNLVAVGCSEEDAEAILTQVCCTVDFLRQTYPVMKPGMERKPGFLRWAASD